MKNLNRLVLVSMLFVYACTKSQSDLNKPTSQDKQYLESFAGLKEDCSTPIDEPNTQLASGIFNNPHGNVKTLYAISRNVDGTILYWNGKNFSYYGDGTILKMDSCKLKALYYRSK